MPGHVEAGKGLQGVEALQQLHHGSGHIRRAYPDLKLELVLTNRVQDLHMATCLESNPNEARPLHSGYVTLGHVR
jgi:hypothetical protein